jgi:quinol-cytochrome oxidoreductase complex cytochrome b subunit
MQQMTSKSHHKIVFTEENGDVGVRSSKNVPVEPYFSGVEIVVTSVVFAVVALIFAASPR